ncbi:tektin-2 isoform X2 [Pangasianodon hypophthalmus]|uniref:tektin-2 isoform X2 n=1 Tax=Pangasianodon hypophthalmus TaxID=310915 RepID=UPI0023072753|nr:tektin-2 isoform X2 [Pangasianodon hypophthalmus]
MAPWGSVARASLGYLETGRGLCLVLKTLREKRVCGAENSDMATLSIKPGLRCTVSDWTSSNNEISVTAEHQRHLSHGIRLEGRALCNDTANKTMWDEYDSNRRLGDRISDITLWKKSLEACAEELDAEMDALTLTKEAAERALAATVLPLEVTNECLTLREGRRGNELVSDPVEAELKKEVEVIDKAQQVLQQCIEQAFKHLCLLQDARHQLTLDLQHKMEALDVDMSCLSLSVMSPEISLKPNPTRIPPGSTTPQQWVQFSHHNITQAKEEMQASLHLRENISITIAQVQNELESQRIASRFASRKRTHQLEQAQQELQWQIKTTQDEMNELKEDILRLERDVQSKMAPLKLVHTRLEYRTRRPGVDLCRDEVQYGLVEETKELASSILALKQKLAQAQDSLQALQLHEARMLEDLARKQEALSLEQRSMQTRQRLNSAPSESEPAAALPLTNSSGMHKLQLKYTDSA